MKLSDGVIVLIITACSYLFSYAFYAGYYNAKDIPIEFITVDFISMLKIGFGLCFFICFVTMFTDYIELDDKKLGVSYNTKLFLIRNSLGFIVGFLIFINSIMTLSFSTLFPYCFLMYIFIKKEIEIKPKDSDVSWYKRRYSFSVLPPRNVGTAVIAEKLNMRFQYVYFSWFLAALFLAYHVGVTYANLSNINLLCNDKFDVIQISGDSILISKDYKVFEFIEKTNCTFTPKYNKKN
ncbi:hypothetical protein [Yersinia enterocolitica]